MENSTREIYKIKEGITDYSISTLIGLSISVVTMLFAFTAWSIKIANIQLQPLEGAIRLNGDPSLLYLAIFLISATMLIVVQYHFQRKYEEKNQ